MNEKLTAVEVDELLEAVADLESVIAAAQAERDNLIARYTTAKSLPHGTSAKKNASPCAPKSPC